MRAPDFWRRRGLAATLLAPLGALYGASVAFKARHASPYRSKARVLCVGNLTAGGSGKTPVAIALAQMLLARGSRVFFLTRGYGGDERGPAQVLAGHNAAQMGDEALLLAAVAPTIVAHDRAEGAALAETHGADIIVMDDGFQNFALAKDVSILVMDGETGNGLMIPAGPLRESVAQGLARTDAVILVGDGAPDLHGFAGPVLRAKLAPLGEDWRGRRVFAFAGIGRPEKFFASLGEAGAIVTGRRGFADHHPYRPDELASLRRDAKGVQLVTTQKDFVRLSPADRAGIAVLNIATIFADDPAPLLDRLTS